MAKRGGQKKENWKKKRKQEYKIYPIEWTR